MPNSVVCSPPASPTFPTSIPRVPLGRKKSESRRSAFRVATPFPRASSAPVPLPLLPSKQVHLAFFRFLAGIAADSAALHAVAMPQPPGDPVRASSWQGYRGWSFQFSHLQESVSPLQSVQPVGARRKATPRCTGWRLLELLPSSRWCRWPDSIFLLKRDALC